ncbi:hypothetical protein [Streptosporangium sp. NPDC087985]|uniref:hypothetical protein n=1 Tax=Streptosporangium sp. NPDC087985 TaxID=3366196 RepID=UPI003824DEE3
MPNLGPVELLILLVLPVLVITVTIVIVLVRRGSRPPAPLPSGHSADLATRVRLLKDVGRAEQAVLLVRGETGMSGPDAQRFVESIQA